MAEDQEGLGERVGDPPRQLGRVVRALDAGAQDGELVALQPGEHVAVLEPVAQAPGHRLEQAVAELLAEGVVDALEAVEVDVQQRRDLVLPARALQLLLGAVLERGGVRQAGQAVEAGRARAVGLLLPQLGDVERDAQHLGGPARRVGERGLGGQEAALAAAELDRLVARARERHAGLAHLLVAHAAAQRVVLAVRLGQRAAERLLPRQAEQRRVRLVGEDEPALAVDDRDRGRDGVEHPAEQVLAGRRLLPRERLLEARGAVGQEPLLAPQRQQVARPGAELEVVDRAQQEVGRPGLERAVAEFPVLVDGDDHDRDVVALAPLAQGADEGGAVHLRHVEVGDDQVALEAAVERVERLDRARVGADLQAFLDREREARQDVAVRDPVVDDDNSRHASLRRGVADRGTGGLRLRGSLPRRRPLSSYR